MDYKPAIIDALDTLKKRDIADKNPFKAKAYEKVIKQLREYNRPIHTIDDLAGIQGIGEKIHAKIVEILATGVLASAERVKSTGTLDSLEIFQGIYGVGPAKASALVKAGYKTIDDLRKAIIKEPSILNANQTIGLAYYEDLLKRIPRAEMEAHEKILVSSTEFPIEIVGSYRRGQESSGDVDVLIRIPEGVSVKHAQAGFESFISKLEEKHYIVEILAKGTKKCMAISRCPGGCARRLDLLLTPADEYAYALLYFTGSDKYNVAFRAHALTCGYTLNEHGMKPIREDVPPVPTMKTEKDICKFLKLAYVEPSKRIDEKQVVKTFMKPKLAL